ncbi:hypothetical protein Anas_06972 [Armadillidium nasatum]|uniref:F-box domain-containing protein n=1 Tax=Armadillidium nasatum TaxID=96803 RepID=A0A5N5SRF4_9CRUS|nr:hypothetical protein Anas_06972 [Armadillidium nasatum]
MNSDVQSLSFFQLPYPCQVEIVAYLSLEDTRSFAATSVESSLLTKEQIVWRKKLWYHSKVINLCLEGRKAQPKEANFLVRDPLLVDMKKLYEVLNPQLEYEAATEEVERENFLSKINQTPQVMSFSSVGLQDLLNFLNTFFHRPPPIFYDPFSRGHDAPSFILFGPPETYNSRKFALSLITSKNSVFETVGLVKGRPGGLGGGVTVKFGSWLMNFLPVRRARPRLLVEDSSTGVSFHPDVAEVVKDVDGMIYYFDAKCSCNCPNKPSKRVLTSNFVANVRPNWQVNQEPVASEGEHPMNNEFYELEAMLRATPNVFPPILVIMVYNHTTECSDSSESSDSDSNGSRHDKLSDIFHAPSDAMHRMLGVENPWMVLVNIFIILF